MTQSNNKQSGQKNQNQQNQQSDQQKQQNQQNQQQHEGKGQPGGQRHQEGLPNRQGARQSDRND